MTDKEREAKFKKIKKHRQYFKEIELLGVTDLAELLDVNKSRISRLYKSDKFVDPVGLVGGRPVWLKEEVLFYLERKRENETD